MKNSVIIILKFIRANLEALIWLVALISLALTIPENDHYSFCVFHNLGFKYCPGCGLGHSISYFFHGEITKSFNAHPLGIFAVVILTYRIIFLFKRSIKNYKLIIKT